MALSRLCFGAVLAAGVGFLSPVFGAEPAPALRLPRLRRVAGLGAGAPVRLAAGLCREQRPFPFLLRSAYIPAKGRPEGERLVGFSRALRYRAERYGFVKGSTAAAWSVLEPGQRSEPTVFAGKPVRLHRRILSALRCAEVALERECASTPYAPKALIGVRFHASFTSAEVSNHQLGVAVDIDPGENTCCHCIPPYSLHKACRDKSLPRYIMPKCWIPVLERFGFYWLGNDTLEDTMHFEFLANPDRVLLPAPTPAPPR